MVAVEAGAEVEAETEVFVHSEMIQETLKVCGIT